MLLSSTLLLATLIAPLATASPLVQRASAAVVPTYASPNGNWSLLGCVMDQYPAARVMSGEYTSTSTLTPASCISYCTSKNFHLAGIENGNQCYCSQELYNGAVVGPHGANLTAEVNDGCTIPSAGDQTSNGGGNNHLLVFQSHVFPQPTIAAVPGATYVNCYPDDVNNRLLPAFQTTQGTLTNKRCVAACQSAGYDLAGTENANQCWCGTLANVTLPLRGTPEGCNLACPGGTTKLCGGAGFLTVYSFPADLATSSSANATANATATSTATSTA